MDAQEGVPGSTLELYRTLLAQRRERRLGVGTVGWLDGWGEDVVALLSTDTDRPPLAVLVNLGSDPVPLPEGSTVVAASGPLPGGRLPTDTAVWLEA